MTPDVSVVGAGDYAELSRFLASFPDDRNGEAVWLHRLGHWWDRNPTFTAGTPRGWLLRTDQGAIAGFLGNIPRLFRAQGEDRCVFCATTWRVLPSHRNASLRLYTAHVAAGKQTLLFNTTPNAAVVKVLDYLKYGSVASSRSGRAFLLPLNAGRVAHAHFREGRRPAALAGVGRLVLAAASLPPALTLALNRQPRARRVESAGAEFDGLWLRTRDEVSNTSVRTADQIRWMCFGGSPRPKAVVGVFSGDDLQAYAIFKDTQEDDLRVRELFDLWPFSATPATVRSLLAAAIERAREDACDMIVLHDFSDRLSSIFRRTGLVLTSADLSRHYIRSAAQPSLDPANSYLTGFEGDAGL